MTQTQRLRATVTQVNPLRIRIDGESSPLTTTPANYAGDLAVGDRVLVDYFDLQVTVLARLNGPRPSVEPLPTHTVTYTSASLANNASATGVITLAPGFTILKVTTPFAARVRLYQSTAHRTADASRPVGVLPSGDHGLIFEEDGSTAASYATVVVGGLLGATADCPIAITNRSGATREVSVTLEVRW